MDTFKTVPHRHIQRAPVPLEHELVPGLRRRLTDELNRRAIPPAAHPAFLQQVTGCAPQTVSRWLDRDRPGLPDLRTFVTLTVQLEVDPGWLLGLLRVRTPLRTPALSDAARHAAQCDPLAWADYLFEQVQHIAADHQLAFMQGDDMAPHILRGAPFFYDPTVHEVVEDGIYFVRYDQLPLVRHVERQPGKGLLLRGDNPCCAPILVGARARTAQAKLRVLGRVTLVINACAV